MGVRVRQQALLVLAPAAEARISAGAAAEAVAWPRSVARLLRRVVGVGLSVGDIAARVAYGRWLASSARHGLGSVRLRHRAPCAVSAAGVLVLMRSVGLTDWCGLATWRTLRECGLNCRQVGQVRGEVENRCDIGGPVRVVQQECLYAAPFRSVGRLAMNVNRASIWVVRANRCNREVSSIDMDM